MAAAAAGEVVAAAAEVGPCCRFLQSLPEQRWWPRKDQRGQQGPLQRAAGEAAAARCAEYY